MGPDWYYMKDEQGEYFVVFADANNSCSRRRFAAGDGSYKDEDKGGAGTSFAEHYRKDLRNASRLGELRGRPNLQDAVRNGRLPDTVLGDLRRLKRSMVG